MNNSIVVYLINIAISTTAFVLIFVSNEERLRVYMRNMAKLHIYIVVATSLWIPMIGLSIVLAIKLARVSMEILGI